MTAQLPQESTADDQHVDGAAFPNALHLPFSSFNNKHAGGTCYVVGRGPTTFDYQDLGEIPEPIFFINDAVCMERFARSETFFFAHDIEMRSWLDGSMQSTAILPVNGTILGDATGITLQHAGSIAFYHRQDEDREQLMRMTRDQLANAAALFGHSGTIHSLLHFAWFCGFRKIVYIGCDGINQPGSLATACGSPNGYDRRLQNRSQTAPGWHYAQIRRVQELLTALLGIESIHIGTPAKPSRTPCGTYRTKMPSIVYCLSAIVNPGESNDSSLDPSPGTRTASDCGSEGGSPRFA
jgi:hypothetical protein